MKRVSLLTFVLVFLFVAIGCRRTMANIYIHNESGATLENIQFSFPKATRGTPRLDTGAKAHHVVKFTESGKLRLSYFDASGKERTSEGPEVRQDFGGDVHIRITANDVQWEIR